FLRAVAAGSIHPGEEGCDVRAAIPFLASCPSLLDAWGASLAKVLAAEREGDGTHLHRHGTWVIQTPMFGDVRIWELTPAGAVLRCRFDERDLQFPAGDRLLVEPSSGSTLLDLRTGVVHEAPGFRFILEHGPFVFGRRAADLVRLHAADLSPAGP